MSRGLSWSTMTIAEVTNEVTSGGTPQSGSSRYYTGPEGIPFAKIDDLTASDGAFISDTILHVNSAALRETALKIYPAGTILLSMYGTIGLVKVCADKISANQALAALVPPFKCDSKYLYHYLVWSRPSWERFKTQTTQANINGSIVKEFPLSLPGIAEQRRIAEILDILDNQISASERILSKLTITQEGLATRLLLCGVGARKDVADSVIGQVPAGWDLAPLGNFADAGRPHLKTGPFGSSLKQEHWVDEGVPVVTIGSLGDGEFIDSELLFISSKTAAMLSSYALKEGDIVFSRVADVGRSVVVGQREKGWIMSSNMMWISLDWRRADPRFVRANIASNPRIRDQIRRFVNSAGRDVANAKIMNSLIFPWPPIEEQREIVDILSSGTTRIAVEQRRLAKLHCLKQGLIADLLSGRVRVGALL